MSGITSFNFKLCTNVGGIWAAFGLGSWEEMDTSVFLRRGVHKNFFFWVDIEESTEIPGSVNQGHDQF
jgi:hypothetical protein